MEEFEVKFLNVDLIKTRKKLKKMGAKRLWRRKFRRKLYDHRDARLDNDGAWLRLRDEGKQVTLTFKKRLGRKKEKLSNDDGMEEIEVVVSDFEKTASILEKSGMICKRYVENFRERFVLDDVEIDLDEYPLIPPFLEIEAKSWKDVDKMVMKLGLPPEEKKIFSGKQIYAFWGIDEDEFDVITFERQILKEGRRKG